jgi:rubrerythrin
MNNIADLLVEAMNAEVKAEEFYATASSKAQSQAGKQFFKELADFEHHHYEKLKGIIESRKKGAKLQFASQKPTFRNIKPEVEGEFEPNKDEIVEVLTLGIKAEKQAQERYTKIAENLSDPEDQEIFEDLAEDERRHHDLLEAQYYQISNKGTIIWE